MNSAHKMIVLNLIYENKHILFGKIDNNLTFDKKVDTWKEITQKIQDLGIFTKDWKYLRDTTWQNWRKRSIEKREKYLHQTGSEGSKRFKFDDADNIIFNIIENNSQESDNWNASITIGTFPDLVEVQTTIDETNTTSENNSNYTHTNNNSDNTIEKRSKIKILNRLRKQKMEAEILLIKKKIEIADREKYKLDLEIIKLEKELDM